MLSFDGMLLQYVGSKNDLSLIRKAIRNHPMALQFVQDQTLLEKESILACVKKDARCFKYLNTAHFREDREIIIAAIHACDSFATLREIVSLVNVPFIWNDQDVQMDILLKAVETITSSNVNLFNELIKNEFFLKKAIEKDSKWLAWCDINSMTREHLCLQHFSPRIRDDPIIMSLAIADNPKSFQFTPENSELRNNFQFMMHVASLDGEMLRCAC